MELERISIYRMTHIENISHILEYGITHRDSPNANLNYITIGDVSLINTRNQKTVIVNNGYSQFESNSLIVLGDFIPFYFGVKMPMLYVMQNGGNFVEKATPSKDIIYIACSLQKIIQSEIKYYFSDGHATDGLTTFYNKDKINDLPNIIEWNSVRAPYWGGQENLNVKRKKQAEFLVLGDLNIDFVVGFGCYNEHAKQKLTAMGIEESKIKIIPNAYY